MANIEKRRKSSTPFSRNIFLFLLVRSFFFSRLVTRPNPKGQRAPPAWGPAFKRRNGLEFNKKSFHDIYCIIKQSLKFAIYNCKVFLRKQHFPPLFHYGKLMARDFSFFPPSLIFLFAPLPISPYSLFLSIHTCAYTPTLAYERRKREEKDQLISVRENNVCGRQPTSVPAPPSIESSWSRLGGWVGPADT